MDASTSERAGTPGERRGTLLGPWLAAIAVAAAYLLVQPFSADLAAQAYRADLFSRAGLALWDNGWYGGHHLLGYSVLFPPLGAWLGVRVTAALAAVAAAWAFERVARAHWPAGWVAGSWWFAIGATTLGLLTGRVTFVLGAAFGLAAILAATHRRWALMALGALLATLGSPIAGLFVALAAVAWGLGGPREDRIPAAVLAAFALVPALALNVLFPEPGVEPFVASAFWPVLAALALVFWAVGPDARVLRIGIVLYAIAIAGAFVLDTPMGGNATRLGALAAGPIAAAALAARGRTVALALVVLPLAYWQLSAPVRDVVRATGDPSVHRGYYAGLLGELRARQRTDPPFRVEVPFTRNHWEARWIPPTAPLARGWERQLDTRRNALFYDGDLTPATYRRWLDDNAVRFVALPDADLDGDAGKAEGALVRRGLPYLHLVWRDRHWRLYEVAAPAPLAVGGQVVRIAPAGFTVVLPRGGGRAVVKIRWTRWWHVDGGVGHLERGPDDTVVIEGRGAIRVGARLL
jgi:MFS family permease